MFDFTETEDHQTIRQTANEFGARNILPVIQELDEKAKPIPDLLSGVKLLAGSLADCRDDPSVRGQAGRDALSEPQ